MMIIKMITSNSSGKFSILSIGGILLTLVPLIILGYSMSNGKKIKPLIVLKDLNRPSLNYDGTRVVGGPEIGLDEVFDVDSGKKLLSLKLFRSESAAISSDGNRVIIFHEDVIRKLPEGYNETQRVYSIYDIDSGNLMRKDNTELVYEGKLLTKYVSVHNQQGSNSRNISSDLKFVATLLLPTIGFTVGSDEDVVIVLTRLDDHSVLRALKSDDGFANGDNWDYEAMTPDGKYIAASRSNSKDVSRRKTVVWNAETGKTVFNASFSTHWLSLSDDGRRLATQESGDDGRIEFWDVLSGKKISTLTEKVKGQGVLINHGVISPNGKILVTAISEDILFWDTETGKFITSQNQAKYSEGLVKTLSFSGDGKRLAVGSDSEVVTVWSVDEILKNAGRKD
jgi:WD40 repeat protein